MGWKVSFVIMTLVSRPARGGGGQGGGKISGARTGLGARNFDKTSGHCATAKRVGGP